MNSLIFNPSPPTALAAVMTQLGQVILGKDGQIRLALACLLARGHLLIEDRPGVGKTTLAHALAITLGLHFQRIQFTSDLLPADILGASVFDRSSNSFRFHPGPIFAQVILADEVNRATPKAQSALLEAMEEGQVTSDGLTRPLPEPFFVIATQNPIRQVGTFPLPESQLDRFLMRIQLGFPDRQAERGILQGEDRHQQLSRLKPVLTRDELASLLLEVEQVHVSEALLDYIQNLLVHSREATGFDHGLSPRAGLAMLHAARAWAFLAGRQMVIPEDVQAILPGVASHRLEGAGPTPGDPAQRLLAAVPVP